MDSNDHSGSGENGEKTKTTEKPKRQSAYRLPEEAVKEGEAEPGVEAEAADEPQAEAPLLGGGFADSIRDTFRQYIIEHVAPPEKSEGPINVNVDLAFLKEHGVPLVNTLVQSLAKAIVPSKLELPLAKSRSAEAEAEEEKPSAKDTAPENSAPEKEGEAQDVDVAVNFDLGNFLKSLLQPRAVPPTEPEK
ncbi:MAG: hypothetical protein JW797_04050 [Bradymonadales bacterium]|nr:hypothetical protein [Bradymonadales bacterium]